MEQKTKTKTRLFSTSFLPFFLKFNLFKTRKKKISFHDEWFSYPNNSNLFDFYPFKKFASFNLRVQMISTSFRFQHFFVFHEIKKKKRQSDFDRPGRGESNDLANDNLDLLLLLQKPLWRSLLFKKKKNFQLSSLD